MEVNPLNIFFVKSDSKGDRLLFRYPYTTPIKYEDKQEKSGRRNPYALNINEDLLQNPQAQTSNLWQGQLSGFTDEMLSTLFAVKAELCNRKFELKVNDVRFVGHPTLLPYRTNKDDNAAMILINIVFALQASASHSIVKCYYDLSKRLGKALRHEEKRCSYLTEEMKIMLAAHDEVSVLDGDSNTGENDEEEDSLRHSVSSTTFSIDTITDAGPKSAFHLILQRSSLARSMRAVFEQLSSKGIVQVRINNWVLLSFCLPHKAHQIYNRGLIIEPETIDRCLQKLRPYHGILLMIDPNELLESIPLDGSPALLRLIKLYSPLKSLQALAIEADLKLIQVFQLTGHLVYWAKATVIYPLCEGNVYVVAPGANIHVNSPLVDEFAREFQGLCLLTVLSEFSLPAPLWYHARGGAGGGADVTRLPVIVAWLLRRRLLLQLHTYVQFNGSNWGKDTEGRDFFCEKHTNIYNPTQPVPGSGNHTQLNIPEPVEQRNSAATFLDSDEDYPTENNLNQTDFSHTQPIIIESELVKQVKNDDDSVNHSFEDSGIDIDEVLESIKQNEQRANSVDSGIASNLNGANKIANDALESETDKDLNPIDIKDCNDNGCGDTIENIDKAKDETETVVLKEVNESPKESSDEDRFDSDSDGSSSKSRSLNGQSNLYSRAARNGVTLKLKLQTETSFQAPTMWNGNGSCDVVDACRPPAEPPSEEALLDTFSEKERKVLAEIPASRDPDDLLLLAQLHKKGYLNGDKHLEVIMFMENLSRSQLMQLLDKFKDVLITFETEDPAVAMLYPYQ